MYGYSSRHITEAPPLQSKQLARVRLFLLGSVAVLVLCLLLFCVPLLFFPAWGNAAFHPIYYSAVGSIGFCALLFVFAIGMSMPVVKRIEQKKQRVLRGDSTLLAEVQPFPDEHVLDLPFTLSLRYRTFAFLRLIFPLILISAIAIGSLFFLPSISGPSLPGLPGSFDPFTIIRSLSVMIGILCLFCAAMLIAVLTRRKPGGYQVTLTSDGIIDASNHRVAWKDARLFAIVNRSSSANASLSPLLFEVASVDTRVQIIWMRAESARQSLLQPRTSYEEHERQMHRVLAVIAAKTGLPLYDLRKP